MLYKYLAGLYAVNLPVMLWSNPGSGKSSMVEKFAEQMNVDLYKFYGSRCEPSDVGGIPYVTQNEKTLKKCIEYAQPRYIEKFQNPGNVLFCDEITTCNPTIQSALLTVVLDCNYGEFQIDKGTFRIAAGNYNNVVGTNKMSLALANRFVHIFHSPDPVFFSNGLVTDFLESQEPIINGPSDTIESNIVMTDDKGSNEKDLGSHKITKELYYKQAVGKFVVTNPEYIEKMPEILADPKEVAWPSERTWMYVAKIWSMLDQNGYDYLKRLTIGTVGETAGRSFMSFIKKYRFQGMDIPLFVGKENTFEFPESASFSFIEATFSSLMYYFSKEPDKYEKLMTNISNLMFDMGYNGILQKYLLDICRTYKHKLNYDPDKFEESFKWIDLVKYASKRR